jgi:hypothetical protein
MVFQTMCWSIFLTKDYDHIDLIYVSLTYFEFHGSQKCKGHILFSFISSVPNMEVNMDKW